MALCRGVAINNRRCLVKNQYLSCNRLKRDLFAGAVLNGIPVPIRSQTLKTILFPYVVLVHSLAMLLGMAAMLFLVITGKMSTPLAYVLPTLTVSLAATSCKLAMLLAKTTEQKRRRR